MRARFRPQGTWRAIRNYSAMQRDLELVFPIKDAASAALMTIKADCLHKAGIINEAEKQHVHSRARTFLDDATLTDKKAPLPTALEHRESAGAASPSVMRAEF